MKFKIHGGNTLNSLGRITVYALIIAMLAVMSFAACACGTQAYADESETAKVISKLSADGTDTVEINDNYSLPNLIYVNGTKTLKGTGTLTGNSADYIIVVNSGASLSLDGVTISGSDKAANGIYVSENASFIMNSGTVKNVTGVAVRVLGKASFNGGSISGAGENWIMVDTGASVDASSLECSNSGAAGIITAEGSSLSLGNGVSLSGSKTSLLYNGGRTVVNGAELGEAEEYAIYNDSNLSIANTEFSGAKTLGYLENSENGDCTIENSTMKDSKADFIYNHGKMLLSNVSFDNCKSTAFEGRGTKSETIVNNCTMDNIGKTAFLCKNGSLTIEGLTVGKCGGNGIHSRGCEINGKNITIKECGAIGFLNDFPSESDDAGVKSFTVDGFEIGHCSDYAIRSNGEYVINDSEYGITSTVELKTTASKNTAIETEDELEDDESADVPDDVDDEGITVDTNHPEDEVNDNASVTNGNPDKPHMTLSNGTVGKSDSYGLYVKGGDVILNDVGFLGTNDTDRAVIQVGYSKTPGGRLTLNEVEIMGGKRAVNNYSILIMNSGNLHGNYIGANVSSTGAGVYNAGTFIMNGGMIYDNYCANSGGAVSNAKDAHFDMYGGIITENKSGGYGGGVTNSGYFNLYNGTISKNYSVKGGGGVRNACVAGLYGGVIKENKSEKDGGGLYCGGSDTCVSGVCIRDNIAYRNGGGIKNSGKMTIQGTSSVYSNWANKGGGVYNSDTLCFNCGLISGTVIGDKSYGGGIYNSGVLSINGGSITNSKAVNGGGVYCTSKGSVVLSCGSIESCTATANGGAIYTYGGTLKIAGNIISCSSTSSGAALYITNGSKTTITAGTITTEGSSTGIFVNNGSCSISESPIIKTTLSRKTATGSYSISGGWFPKAYNAYVAKGYKFVNKKADAPDSAAPYTVEENNGVSLSLSFAGIPVEIAMENLNLYESESEALVYLSSFNVDTLNDLYQYIQNNVELLVSDEWSSGERQTELLGWINSAISAKGEEIYMNLPEFQEDYQGYLDTLTPKELAALKLWISSNYTGLSQLDERALKDQIAATPYEMMQKDESYLEKLDTDELAGLRDYIIANNSEGGETSDAGIEMTDKVDAVVENIAKENLAKLEEAGTVKETDKAETETDTEEEKELTEEEKAEAEEAAKAAELQAKKDAWAAAQKYIASLSKEELKALGLYIDKLQEEAYIASQNAEKAETASKDAAIAEGVEASEEAVAAAAEAAKAAEEAAKVAEEAKKVAEAAEVYENAVDLAKATLILKDGKFHAEEVLTVLLSKDTEKERREVIKDYTLENMQELLNVIEKYDTSKFTKEESASFAEVKKLIETRIAELTPPKTAEPEESATPAESPAPSESPAPAESPAPSEAPAEITTESETSAPAEEQPSEPAEPAEQIQEATQNTEA